MSVARLRSLTFLPIRLSGGAVGRRPRTVGALAFVVAAVLALAAQADAAVTPATGGPRAAFEITFPAQRIALDVQLTAPRSCGDIDDLYISIRRARGGHFRFGPRVPGARPRRDGKRILRWCRGRYGVSVVAREEFEPTSAEEIAVGHFTVR